MRKKITMSSKKKKSVKKKSMPTKKASAKKTIKKKKIVRKPNRFNTIQQILSAYSKETGVKFGKNFTKICAEFNEKTKKYPLKFIEQNVDQLYIDLVKKPVKGEFPNDFKFYKLEETLNLPQFDGVTVSYTFTDKSGEYSASGEPQDVIDEYKLGFYRHLRNNYDGYTTFVLTDTDNKTFADYKVEVGEQQTQKTTPETTETTSGASKTTSEGKGFTSAELIAIEKEKQKTIELELKKIDKVLTLLEKGYTKAEINKLLGIK
jgi:hypothetical protein